MSITIHPPLESELRAKTEAEGISVEAYLARLLRSDLSTKHEIEELIKDALNSGDPIEADPGYWEEKHRRLEERLNNAHQ